MGRKRNDLIGFFNINNLSIKSLLYDPTPYIPNSYGLKYPDNESNLNYVLSKIISQELLTNSDFLKQKVLEIKKLNILILNLASPFFPSHDRLPPVKILYQHLIHQ